LTTEFKTALQGYRMLTCIVCYHPGISNFRL